MLGKVFENYQKLPPQILKTITAQFFIQQVNTSFILVFNIYLAKLGYSDQKIADFTSYRFLGVLLMAIPLGLYIKNRSLKPVLLLAGYTLPITSLFVIYAGENHWLGGLYIFSFFSGIFFSCLQISVLPFIIRNVQQEMQPEAIALMHFTFSASMIFCSLSIFVFGQLPINLGEGNILRIFSILGLIGLYFFYGIGNLEIVPQTDGKKWDLGVFDWKLIVAALIPNTIIAIGAGLTIPFINLFFYTVHGMDYDRFSLLNFITAILVSSAFIYVPYIKRKYGYRVAICLSQFFAILMLLVLGSTEIFHSKWYALYIAIGAYILRQPLMNMAGPMGSHLIMNYVGAKNQEITSALHSAIWSGSWFISAKIFKHLRNLGLDYAHIFGITALIYFFGMVCFYLLILSDEKRKVQDDEGK